MAAALKECRLAFRWVALFSGAVNVLMLAGPLYMLQIYDRVLSGRSIPTLIALSFFLVGAYLFQAVFDIIRSRIVVRAAALLDDHLAIPVHRATVRLGTYSRHASDAHQPTRDLDQIRAFLMSQGPIALVDLPWVPFFLAICFLIHPWLGFISLGGGLMLVGLTMLTERASRARVNDVGESAGRRAAMTEADRRNSEAIIAMGMGNTLAERWRRINDEYLAKIGRSTDVVSTFTSLTKVVRLMLQSAILGLGAYLVIQQELTAGAMIAASIMMSRSLAPIEIAIGNWRGFVNARHSVRRLSEILSRISPPLVTTELPTPSRSLQVENVTIAVPGRAAPILAGVRFELVAGDVLGVIGPSGAGKSSLIRALVGAWPPARGSIRIDGAELEQWDPEIRGSHIGYVPQVSDLFDGTVTENIARMSVEPDQNAILAAAQAAGAHDMILRLPAGYATEIGEGGSVLSAGQRQRISLARGLFGDPFLVVLDEPGSNLDAEGDAALEKAIKDLKLRKAIVILVAHRQTDLTSCEKLLVLANGTQQDFGLRDDIMRKAAARPRRPAAPTASFQSTTMSANLKVVGKAPEGGQS